MFSESNFLAFDPEISFQCITLDNKSVYELTLKRSQLEKK